MVAHVNLKHPRVKKINEADGTVVFEKIPLNTGIGGLFHQMITQEPQWVPFDQLGLGVTLYFKMIKVMIYVLVAATLLSIPILITFSSGNEAQVALGLDQAFGRFSIGNIGQSKDMCIFQDINNCDTIHIHCPKNTQL